MKKIKFLLPLLFAVACMALLSAGKRNKIFSAFSVEKGVVYGHNLSWQGKDEQLDMDIFLPSNAEKGKKYPLVLLIHGGTFLTGKKEGLDKDCQMLADSGFVAVTINYRLGWKIPAVSEGCNADVSDMKNAVYRAFQDSRAALRFLVHNADKYSIDKNWIFVGGASAGAVTALGITYIDQKYVDQTMGDVAQRLGGLNNASNDLKDSYKIKGVCSMWGSLPDSTLITASTAVPAVMFHGTADKVVPYDHGTWRDVCPNFPMEYGSANLYRQLARYRVPAVLTSIIGGKHGPVEFKQHPEVITSNTACFFHHVMRGDAHTASYTDPVAGCR